jgi:hypothetical protein
MLSSKVVGAAEPNKFGAVLLSPLGLIYNSYQATGFKERWIQECDQYAAPQVALKQHQEFLDSYKHLSTAPQRAPQRVLRAVKLILMGPRIRKIERPVLMLSVGIVFGITICIVLQNTLPLIDTWPTTKKLINTNRNTNRNNPISKL